MSATKHFATDAAAIDFLIEMADYGTDEKLYLMNECPHSSKDYADEDRDEFREQTEEMNSIRALVKAAPAMKEALQEIATLTLCYQDAGKAIMKARAILATLEEEAPCIYRSNTPTT